MEPEKDFQTQANEAGERFVESARVLLETLKAAEQNEDEGVLRRLTEYQRRRFSESLTLEDLIEENY